MSDGNVAADQLRLPGERWLPIAGASMYEVSDLGRIISHRKGLSALMKPGHGTCSMRYLRVTLTYDDGVKHVRNVHVLVLATFKPDRPAGSLSLHKDGVVTNCALDNLYWGSPKKNAEDRVVHGRSGKGEKNPNARLSPQKIAEMKMLRESLGLSQTKLGEMFGVSQVQAGRILNGQSWQESI